MNQTCHQDKTLKTMDQHYSHNKLPNFYKRTLQLLISVSLISSFLCISSGFSLFPNSFSVYFNTCLFSFLAHTLERKYMFLIFNGTLAFLAKKSVFTPSGSDVLDEDQLSSTSNLSVVNATDVLVPDEEGEVSTQSNIESWEKQEDEKAAAEEHKVEKENLYAKRKGSEMINREKEGEEEQQQQQKQRGFPLKQEEEEEEEAATAEVNEQELASTEELNRRFEEFIRKMKEEIRIEAQQQLIAGLKLNNN